MDAEFLDSGPYVCDKHFITWAITIVPKLPLLWIPSNENTDTGEGVIEYWQMPEYSYTL